MDIFQTLFYEPLASGLILTYRIFGQNMGVAIIIFSLILRFILLPLTRPYLESMKKMKDYKKDLDRLKKKHGKDKQKYMKAQADFYKEKGINPTAGCLPYILQFVVLIAFFQVFNTTLIAGSDIVSNFNKLVYEPLKFEEGAVINTHFLYLDVSLPDKVEGIAPIALPGPMLIAAAIIQLVSAKITQPYLETEEKIAKKTKSETDDISVAMQQSMVYTFPLITLVIGLSFSSGLVLYWLVFSAFQAVQQYRMAGWGAMTPIIKKLKFA